MANARQIEGWALSRKVRTQTGELTYGFFTDKAVADSEAARMSSLLDPCTAVPATLIMPAKEPTDG